MTQSLLKLCRLIDTVDTFEGTTKLHKIVYVAQVLGHPFREHFQWYRYGPYSPSLALKLEQLVTSGLVRKREADSGNAHSRQDYSLTREGTRFLNTFGAGTEFDDTLKKLIGELHGKRRARDMELIDSILYWEGQGQSRADAVRTVVRAKPKFEGREGEIKRALDDIRILEKHYATDTANLVTAEAS